MFIFNLHNRICTTEPRPHMQDTITNLHINRYTRILKINAKSLCIMKEPGLIIQMLYNVGDNRSRPLLRLQTELLLKKKQKTKLILYKVELALNKKIHKIIKKCLMGLGQPLGLDGLVAGSINVLKRSVTLVARFQNRSLHPQSLTIRK